MVQHLTTKGDAQNWHDIYIDNLEVAEEVASSINTIASEKIAIYPNPTQTSIQIQSEQYISKVELIDIYGKLLDTYSQFEEINLSHLPNGIYFVKAFFVVSTKIS